MVTGADSFTNPSPFWGEEFDEDLTLLVVRRAFGFWCELVLDLLDLDVDLCELLRDLEVDLCVLLPLDFDVDLCDLHDDLLLFVSSWHLEVLLLLFDLVLVRIVLVVEL